MTVDVIATGTPATDRSLRRLVVSGALWVGIGTLANYGLRIVSSVVLTRLIAPGVFGMMDLVMVFIVGLHLFSDIGIGPGVIRSPRGAEPAFLQTAWTLQALRGLVLALGACALALPAAWLYERPLLLWMLPVMGLFPLIEGVCSPGLLLAQRNIERRLLVLLELGTGVLSLVATVLGVYLFYPAQTLAVFQGRLEALPADQRLVWALIGAWLTARIGWFAASFWLAPQPPPRFRWDRDAVRELLHFGKWIFLSTLITFFATQSDRLLLPKLISFEAIGVYGRAAGLLAAGSGVILALQTQVVFPACSRMLSEGRPADQVFTRVHRILALASAVVVTGAIACGPALSRALYPKSYSGVDDLMPWLAVAAWFQLVTGTVTSFLLAAGKLRAFILPQVVKTVATFLLIYPLWELGRRTSLGPFYAVVLAFLLGDVATYGAVVVIARRYQLAMFRLDLALMVGITLLSPLARTSGELILGRSFEQRGGWLGLFALQGTFSVLVWGVIALVLWRLGWLVLRPQSSSAELVLRASEAAQVEKE